jgi:uncharacterized protein (TIGR03086 family)
MRIELLRALNRRAVQASVDVVGRIAPDDLARPTPCAEWTVADLLAHMTVQHHGFAAAARGDGADPEVWRAGPSPDDPAAAYAVAAEDVLAAFEQAKPDFWLPEITTAVAIPAATAISFHLVDYVAHAWDVAQAIGLPYRPDPEVTEAALTVALAVPDGAERLEPGAAFRPGVPASPDSDALTRLLAALGRSADWRR